MPSDSIQTLVCEQGFPAYYLIDASLANDVPEGISSFLLMLYPYDSWGKTDIGCVRISTYYFAAQDAYLKAGEIVQAFHKMGESARLCNDVHLKPLLSRIKDFTQGRNTLHYHKEYGSRFHMQVIGLEKYHPMDESILRPKNESSDMCGNCNRCMQACPANALSEEGFLRDKCLRQHMQSGKPIPVPFRALMGNRLLGCDECQQACPYNAGLPKGETAGECFQITDLLKQDESVLKSLSHKIGRNMAIPNRILNQTAIIAGNSREKAYLPILEKLCHHPSLAVSEHAKWAVKVLSNESEETTT